MSGKFDEQRVLAEVQRLVALIEKDLSSQPNEHTTEVKYIIPLLEALGWSVADDSLRLQYAVKSSVVDMALMAHGKPVAFVEAKRLRQDLSLKDNEAAQALQYGYESGTDWCVLTNGERYEIYDAFAKVDHSRKLVVSFALSAVAKNPDQGMAKLRLLSHGAIVGGELRRFARHRFACERVREALEKPSPALLDTLLRELQSYGLAAEDVQAGLAAVLGRPVPEHARSRAGKNDVVERADGKEGQAVWGVRAYGPPLRWLDRWVWFQRARPLKHDTITDGVSHDSLFEVVGAVSALAAEGQEFDRYLLLERSGLRSGGVAGKCLGVLWVAGLLELARTDAHGREFLRLRKPMTADEIIAAVRAKAEPGKS